MLPPAALVALAAQSLPPTVIAPRMPFVFSVAVVTPFVALCAPAGSVRLSVPPALRTMPPRVSRSGFAVALGDSTIDDAPGLIVTPANCWLFEVLALPVR